MARTQPVLVPHHATETRGVEGVDGHQRDRGVDLAAHLEQRRHEVRGEQRHVAAQHDHLVGVVGQDREGRPDRVRGAARLVLDREVGTLGEDLARPGRWPAR